MADSLDKEIRAQQEKRASIAASSQSGKKSNSRIEFGAAGSYDNDIYGDSTEYVSELGPEETEDGANGTMSSSISSLSSTNRFGSTSASAVASIRAAQGALAHEGGGDDEDPMEAMRETHGSGLVNTRISDRESTYHARRTKRMISPERGGDAFSNNGARRTYADIMKDRMLQDEEERIRRAILKKREEGEEKEEVVDPTTKPKRRKRRRWDVAATDDTSSAAGGDAKKYKSSGNFGETPAAARFGETPAAARFGETPAASTGAGRFEETPVSAAAGQFGETPSHFGETPSRFGETPRLPKFGGSASATGGIAASKFSETPVAFDATPSVASRWDETPQAGGVVSASTATTHEKWDETPVGGTSKKRSRWDETPVANTFAATPSATPVGGIGLTTPLPGIPPPSASVADPILSRFDREMAYRNRPLSDEELDAMFPTKGYKIVEPPPSYVPIRSTSQKLMNTPTPYGQSTPAFHLVENAPSADAYGVPGVDGGASDSSHPFIRPEDYQYFSALMTDKNPDEMTADETKERAVMMLLLKIKNGSPPQRKSAFRQITKKARHFGAAMLFNQILPLLMAPTLEDQERHLLVKVIDRVLYKLDDLVRPYVHKILVVIEPLLIDEDYYARIEGREIISNLAKAAGLHTMISVMRPDIDNLDEYVRNTTARAFSVVASALGIPALLPFLKAVCQSRTSWQARHTGIKIVQQIAILVGSAVLPHLNSLVECVEHGLVDDQQKVRTITGLALAALAESAHPYGIESFDSVLRPLWKGIRQHRGKGLAAFLKAIGNIIPLMDANYANYYTKEVMPILIREFQSPDDEIKKIVLKVVKQCVKTDGVEVQYVVEKILPEFFRHFWVRRMALDRRNYRQLVETTVELSNKVGIVPIVSRIVDDLKDDSEPYRRMVMDTVEKVCQNLGVVDVDTRLEERLIDGVLYAFQMQKSEADTKVILKGFGTVVNALGVRAKPYLPQICGIIKFRLNHKSAAVRMQAADLIGRIAVVMMQCEEDKRLGHMGVVLYEYLGEEYPEVLGSILGGLKSIVNVIGMTDMKPPIRDLLPRLTPILKNRHEKVQENCIDLVGRIADRGPEHVTPKEWMRICFELLEMLKAPKKAIRRATVNTFGYIAKAIGPQDVLHTLLNNLKVQDRTNRVCTTVAIAIVAETCSPFTVLPALMNEYRVPELNVQNGVLKALSFMFEYIGEMGRDYVYAVIPLLEDALMDRDMVHRQTACATVKHITLGLVGLGCEDAVAHLLNFVWPNIFETSPHVKAAVFGAVEACRKAGGVPRLVLYLLQGLFHPARKVREVYWQIYNNTYVYDADALVPMFPRLEDEEGTGRYERTHLEMMV